MENGTYYQTIGCAFDQQMIWENNNDTLKAAELLGKNDAVLDTIREQINLLDPVLVGYSGQVKEYREEDYYGEIGEYNHRHISQLVGLYPGTSINASTPAWMDAAKATLNLRGDESTGWAMAHRLNAWARLQDGNRAYRLYQQLLKSGTLTNLWDTHPPFQIDGNFGGTSGVAEMLLQSQAGYIDILPALPEAWDSGSFSGLVARGNFEVSADWENGKASNITILSNKGGECKIKYNGISSSSIKTESGKTITTTQINGDLISFDTITGEKYIITEIPAVKTTQAPAGLTAVTEDYNTFSLNWSARADSVSYNVYKAVEDAADYTLIAQDITGTSYNYQVPESERNKRTTFRITAVGENGRESSGITAVSVPYELIDPTDVTGIFTTDTTLKIFIGDGQAGAKYNLYKETESGFVLVSTSSVSTQKTMEWDVSGVSKSDNYFIRMIIDAESWESSPVSVSIFNNNPYEETNFTDTGILYNLVKNGTGESAYIGSTQLNSYAGYQYFDFGEMGIQGLDITYAVPAEYENRTIYFWIYDGDTTDLSSTGKTLTKKLYIIKRQIFLAPLHPVIINQFGKILHICSAVILI